MKTFRLVPLATAVALVVSCEKPPSDADKNAQIEREVQQRLAAEHQADEQQRLAQQQADVEAREKAIAEKESTQSTQTAATPRVTPRIETRVSSNDGDEARSYDTFYRKLEPYGAWRETSTYGYVWQPREAQQRRDWRPYTDGRWAYTDAGWTWISDERFGWATYHYGRWTRLSGIGWVWVPGEEWAPAWVSWRASDQHVGWAPLPPEARLQRTTGIKKWADSYYDIDAGEYVFIPNEEIGVENVQRVVIPQERNITIVNETTNVTNITYNNTTIVNEGPDFNELRSRSRQPLQRFRIAREYNVDETQNPQAVVRGETIAMMTPLFSARAVERPRTVGAPITQTTVERATVNQPDAERARAKMRAEATPPPDAPPKRFEKPQIAPGASAPAAMPARIAQTPIPAPSVVASVTPAPVRKPLTTPIPSPSLAPSVTPVPVIKAPTAPFPTAIPSPTATGQRARAPRDRRGGTSSPGPITSPTASPLPTATPSTTVEGSPTPSPSLRARRIAPLTTPQPSASAPPATAAPPVATLAPTAVATLPPPPPIRRSGPLATATPAMTPAVTPTPAAPAQPSVAAEMSPSPATAETGEFERPPERGTARAAQLQQQQEERKARFRDVSRAARNMAPAPNAPQPPPLVSPAASAANPEPTLAPPANPRLGVPSRRLPAITPVPSGTAKGLKPALSPVPANGPATSPTPTPTPTAAP